MTTENFNKILLVIIVFLLIFIINNQNNSKVYADFNKLQEKIEKIVIANKMFKGSILNLDMLNRDFKSNNVAITVFSKNSFILVDSEKRMFYLYNIQTDVMTRDIKIKLLAQKRY